MGFLILLKRELRIVANAWEDNEEAADILSGEGIRDSGERNLVIGPLNRLLVTCNSPLVTVLSTCHC